MEELTTNQSEINKESNQELLPAACSTTHTFTYQELKDATQNFSTDSLIGEGGFGFVYKGQIGSSSQAVAIKKLNLTGFQGEKEFLVEVLMLSLLRHPNLVNMIGCCTEGEQRLLVYEFMPLGSLEDHLHDIQPGKEPLDWDTRLIIAAGAAKGLDYLHNEAKPSVIYRDFKSSNILLGENFHPKLSDFGLAKFGPIGDNSHVSTRVMGTQGYCAPEYALTGKLTVKSDIYSFGVVLLELITGHRAIDPTRGHGRRNLVEWMRPHVRDYKKHLQLVDPRLKGRFSEPSLHRAIEVAFMCVRENAKSRPTMSDVVLALNYLLSQNYDPNAVPAGPCWECKDEESEDGGGNSIGNRTTGKGRRHASMGDLKGMESDSPMTETTRMLHKDLDREKAVAEAKLWGESSRAKRRPST